MIRGDVWKSKKELVNQIMSYIKLYNEEQTHLPLSELNSETAGPLSITLIKGRNTISDLRKTAMAWPATL